MVSVVTAIDIDCPLDKVARFAADPDNAPAWYVNIESAAWKTDKPLSVGSQIDFKAHFLGKEMAYTYEVTEMSDRKFVMQTAQGPFPMKTTYEWEALSPVRTRMILKNEGHPSGFSKLLTPFISMMMRKANRKDLEKLKKILEMKG